MSLKSIMRTGSSGSVGWLRGKLGVFVTVWNIVDNHSQFNSNRRI